MDLTRITVILVLLAATTCRAQLVIKTSKLEQSMARLTEALVNIVTSCHKGRINGVALAGNLPSTLYKALSVEHSIPIVLIEGVYKYGDQNKPRIPFTKNKQSLYVFIIEAADGRKILDLIESNIHRSVFWNSMAKILIVDPSRNCENLIQMLLVAWFLNVLHAKVLCRNHNSGIIIFDYNPFTGYAPVSWRKAFEYFQKSNNHMFTVFSREYVKNEIINCDDMHFDKTLDLGGYYVITEPIYDYSQKTDRVTYAYQTTRRHILGTLFRHLNATAVFKTIWRTSRNFIQTSPQELYLSSWVSQDHIVLTYPHKQVAASIITQFRGNKSQLTKILSIVDANSLFGMGVVYLVTLIFLKIFVGQAVIPAVLNLIRLTCNTGIVNLPNNNTSRIYIGCLLFFVVTMQGIFQGDLATRLTKYMPLRNVESIKDLEYLGYTTICGQPYYRKAFEGLGILKNFQENIWERNCLIAVTKDLSSAYIGRTDSFIIDFVEKYNLHVSNKPVEMMYMGFRIPKNWVLEERVNKIISRLVEANALELWESKCKPIELSDFYVDPAVKSNVDVKKLELHELAFAFAILGIGLTSATIVLVIELAIRYKCICAITIWKSGNTWEERVVYLHD